MRLAPRLAITFGLLAAVSTTGAGLAVRHRLAQKETLRFQREVEGACERVVNEVRRQGEADQTLIAGACQGGELVERVGIALDRGELDARRTGFSQIVSAERTAFDLDELVLAVEGGDLVGASPTRLLALPPRDVDAMLARKTPGFTVRAASKKGAIDEPALVSRCIKPSDGGRLVGMIGARHLDPLLDRLAETVGVTVSRSRTEPSADPHLARATCSLDDGAGDVLALDVLKSTKELEDNLHDVDRTVGLAAAISVLVAFIAATFLARSLSRPLSVLAKEAGKVAAGEARPLRVSGKGEVAELVTAFDRMIDDLAVTRRRLAAASRVAAWREVARRVAHEVKNPLAPIRAAVETLRRLRAREDPRFDEYFDEATRTVLDEVHRISNIVTEFTRFARLPPPRPQEVDPEELARHIVQIHKAAAGDVLLRYVSRRRPPTIQADRDQVIQVLTNLVQNALDAARDVPGGAVTLTTEQDGHYVGFSVSDNGAGLAKEIAARLFEPYATTKAKGTGLGLAIAQRIALEHQGELSYLGPSASTPDGQRSHGAVFRLLLPVEGPPPPSESPTSDG